VAGGTILKGDDGSTYFVRDEVLAACKVEGEFSGNVDSLLGEQEVTGFSFDLKSFGAGSTSSVQPVAYVSGDLVGGSKDMDLTSVRSTVMCPW